MARQAFAIYQQYADAHYDSGMTALRQFVARILPGFDVHYVVADNALPPGREFLRRGDETMVSGDNSGREFSGFDAAVAWCSKRFALRPDTPVVVANDTFHRSYGTDYLARFTPRLVKAAIERQGIVGHIDAYPEQASLLGYTFTRWIRTSLFVLPYATLQRLAPFHWTFDHGDFFRADADPRFFADHAPLSDAYRRMLRTWLFADAEPGAVFAESWHSKRALTAETVDHFRNKCCAIFCEHLLSARAEGLGIPLIDINARRHDSLGPRRHVVVVDHYVPQPDRDAGSRTMVEFMRAMVAVGCDVTFVPANGFYDPEYTPALTALGVRRAEVTDDRLPVPRWLAELGDIDVLLLSRPDVCDSFLPVARELGIGPVLFYGHDIHWQRMRVQESIARHEIGIRETSAQMRQREEAIWRSVDVVLYPSAEEVDSVRAYLAGKAATAGSAARVAPPYSFTPVSRVAGWASRRHLLFVAGFAHPPNIDAARWLCEEIMPLIWRQSPDTVVQIVGSNPTPAVKALRSSRVEVTGNVTDQELHKRYAESLVAVVPLRIGAGVKNKVLEAMAHGLPMVTTSVGVQGLPHVTDFCGVEDSARGFAEATLALMHSPERWAFASEMGHAFISREFSQSAMEGYWAELLDWAVASGRKSPACPTDQR